MASMAADAARMAPPRDNVREAGAPQETGDPAGRPLPTQQPNVLEMLEYVRGLDLDPVRDAELLWIAEEAYGAPLPPNWTQHYDDQGRVYYHHAGTGESSWKHPMDEAFRACVQYARLAWADGGFWNVDDQLIEIENTMRERLSDWMELYDAHGEKFYYNQRTQESTFDDPRSAVYHDLYARIKMVAKMKSKWPMLARAPRPEAPTTEELELQRLVVEEEQKYIFKVLKVQSMIRAMIARRRMARKQAQRMVGKGPQPLVGKLRLRLEGGQGHNLETAELRLALTTPHRRERAATKIQALARGAMARAWVLPILMHHKFLAAKVTKIQCRGRIMLAKIEIQRRMYAKHDWATLTIQRMWRGFADRSYVNKLVAEKARFEDLLRRLTILQSYFRMFLAEWRVRVLRHERKVRCAHVMWRNWQCFWEQRTLQRKLMLRQPVRPTIDLVPADRGPYASFGMEHFTPWTMNLWTAPLTALGDLDDNCDDLNAFTGEAGHEWWRKPADLAATQIQRRQRGIFSRRRVKFLREMTKSVIDDVLVRMFDLRDYTRNWVTTVADAAVEKSLHHAEVATMCIDLIITKTIERSVERQEVAKYCFDYMLDETVERSWRRTYVVKHAMDVLLERTVQAHHYRWRQAVKIQAVVRGKQCRKVGWFHLKRLEMMRRALPKITMWQATIKRNKAQWRVSAALEGWRREVCAIAIQAVWRGFCARRAVEFIREMATWPMKIWFDYAMIGTSSVTCACRIAENERFDPYRYFLEHPGEELETCLDEMVHEVDVCVTSYLTATGYDLLDPQVLPEELPEDTMPDFQHGSIRQAMATLQSIDFDAMRAETALALEQAKAAMEAAEEQDRAELEAAEAEIGDVAIGDLPTMSPGGQLTAASLGLDDEASKPGTPSVVMTEHSFQDTQFVVREAAAEVAFAMVDVMERDVLVQRTGLEKAPEMEVLEAAEPLTPVTPARALEGISPEQVALAQSLALSGPLTMLLGQRDMGPLVEGLVLEDRPPSEMDLPSARGSEADFGLEGLDPSPKRGDRSKLREMPILPEDTLITEGVRPTEQLLTETHPATSGDDARARIANELGAYRIARGLEPEKQRLPKSMPDQYEELNRGFVRVRTPELVQEPTGLDSKPPSSAPPPEEKKADEALLEESEEESESDDPMAGHGRRKKQADDEPVVKEAEDPAVRAERKQTLVPQGGAYVADLLQKVWRMEEARLAGKAVPRLQLAGASERETDLQAPDTPTWLASGYAELVPVEPPKPPPVPAEVQYFRQWVLDKFTTFAEGWAQLDPKGVGSLTAGEFRDGVAGKWQYCDPRQATKLFFLHSLSTEARMTRVDFGFSDQQWQDYLVLAQQRRDREAQQKAEGRAGGTGLPGEPKVREPRPPPEPLVPEGEQSTAAGVLHDAQRAEGIPGMQSPRSAASRPATPAEMLVQEELPLDEDPELAGALDDWVDPDTVPQEDSEDERPATTESQKKAKEEAAEWGEEEGEEEDIFPQDEEPPAQEEDDDDAAKRAEEMGVLKAIDSSVKMVQRTEQEITGEVSEKINRVIPSSFEDVAGQRVSPRPPSSVGHPSEAEPDPYAEERLLSKQGTPEAEGKPAAASERMAATPEMSVKSQHEVVGAVVKTEEGVVLPKIDAEKVRNVTGKDPLEKKMQKKAPKITKDHSAGSELVRKMMRAPGGLQANAARMSDQMRQLLLEEMRQERLMKLKDIQEKEARRETQKKEAEAADKAAIEEIKKAKMAAADIDTELADAQRSEMAAWRRKKAMESEKKRVAEKALLEKAQAEQKEKARLKAEKEAQWKEEKQRRLRSHRKRVEAQAQAVSSGKGGAELPVITRHVHHHVHSHSVDSEDPSATIVNGEPLMAGESIETARGGVWAYPSERTGLYPSEGEPSVGPYASERYFRSIEEDGYDSGKETTRLAAKHKLSASASLPVLDPPSEMRRGGPTVANKLASGRYGASVNKASATYANAGRIRGAIR